MWGKIGHSLPPGEDRDSRSGEVLEAALGQFGLFRFWMFSYQHLQGFAGILGVVALEIGCGGSEEGARNERICREFLSKSIECADRQIPIPHAERTLRRPEQRLSLLCRRRGLLVDFHVPVKGNLIVAPLVAGVCLAMHRGELLVFLRGYLFLFIKRSEAALEPAAPLLHADRCFLEDVSKLLERPIPLDLCFAEPFLYESQLMSEAADFAA